MHTVDAFRAIIPDADITLVLSRQGMEIWQALCRDEAYASPRVVEGGASRAESVANALDSADIAPDDTVLVHDGARPLVDAATVARVLDALGSACAAIPAVPVTDSVRILLDTPDGGQRSASVDRSRLRAVQTPQGFRAGLLLDAYALAREAGYSNFTDEASIIERFFPDEEIVLTTGNPSNIKITNPSDIDLAEALMKEATQTGSHPQP